MTEPLPAYLISGGDAYLLEEATREILAGFDGYDVEEFGPQDDAAKPLAAITTPPLLGGRRAVVIQEIDSFPAETRKAFAGYLASPSPDVVLVLIASRPVREIAEAVKKVGKLVSADRGRRGELIEWVRAQFRTKNLKPTAEGVRALIDVVGEERMALSQALEEASLAFEKGARIGPDEIKRQFSGRADAKLFGFIDAVASRNKAAALALLEALVKKGESPFALFWPLTRHFRMLLSVEGAGTADVAKSLRIPAWRAEKLVRQAKGFTTSELITAYQVLAEADRKMKHSEEPELLTLQRAVVSLAGRS